jgi:hypothetical protein
LIDSPDFFLTSLNVSLNSGTFFVAGNLGLLLTLLDPLHQFIFSQRPVKCIYGLLEMRIKRFRASFIEHLASPVPLII